jgi:hypothetical protein
MGVAYPGGDSSIFACNSISLRRSLGLICCNMDCLVDCKISQTNFIIQRFAKQDNTYAKDVLEFAMLVF